MRILLLDRAGNPDIAGNLTLVTHLGWLQGSSRGVQQAQCTDGEKPVCSLSLLQNSVRGMGDLLTLTCSLSYKHSP